MKLVKRAAWGARNAVGKGNLLIPNPFGVAIHWSGINVGANRHSLCGFRVQGIQRYHQVTKGWADIAYSFLVCQHGFVYEGRGIGKGSAANGTTEGNLDYYAVCALMGPKDTPTAEMLAGIGQAIDACRKAGAHMRVLGHRDLYNSECPGKALYDLILTGHWTSGAVEPSPTTIIPGPPKPRPPSVPVIKRPPQIAVDGVFGRGTKMRLQQWAGVIPDGNLGGISWRAIQRKVKVVEDGNPGVRTWKAIQKLVGAVQDGAPGIKTYRALQDYLNKH